MDKNQAQQVLDLIGSYKPRQWVYPGVLIRKLSITMKLAYLILEKYTKEGITARYYETHCCSCTRSTGETYEVLNRVPDTFVCDYCDYQNTGIENAVMIYRML